METFGKNNVSSVLQELFSNMGNVLEDVAQIKSISTEFVFVRMDLADRERTVLTSSTKLVEPIKFTAKPKSNVSANKDASILEA